MRKIRIYGVTSRTGIGTHSKSIFEIGRLYLNSNFDFEFINCQSNDEIANAIATSGSTDVNICFFPETFVVNLKGLKVYYCVFEASRPHPGHEQWLNRFDVIFSPSRWGRDCMIRYGISAEKIHIVAEGVDPYLFHPYYKKSKNISDPFRIFMLGKYESRKGYEVALEAFRMAHLQLPFIELNIKPDWITPQGSILPPQLINILNGYRDIPIVIMSGSVDTIDLIDLYRRAELFLFPSLCEGWGLPLIEALACGVPAVSCDFGGHSEFLKEIEGLYYGIPYSESPIDCKNWKETYIHENGDWGNWANIDAHELAGVIVNSVLDEHREYKGLRASEIIRNKFNWARSVEVIMKTISMLI